MYAGGLLYMIGMPLLLGSWLGLLVLPLIVGALSVRIFIEEAALRQGRDKRPSRNSLGRSCY